MECVYTDVSWQYVGWIIVWWGSIVTRVGLDQVQSLPTVSNSFLLTMKYVLPELSQPFNLRQQIRNRSYD